MFWIFFSRKEGESWQYKLAKMLVMNKVKLALGLDRCRTLASGAAPLAADVKEYFMGMDLPIVEAFGMSESGGAQCLSSPDEFNLTTIGKPLPGVDTLIANPDDQGHGEVIRMELKKFLIIKLISNFQFRFA